MALLTVAQARAHVETDLTDEALQRLVDDAELEIIEYAGEADEQVDETRNAQLSTCLLLSRKAVEVIAVVEEIGGDETTLAADDYRLRNGGHEIERLGDGTNPRTTWGETVTVSYVPADRAARRVRVMIDLVKLAVRYSGAKSESIGDFSSTSMDYEEERSRLLSRLREGLGIA